jgi:hypothetical protein
MSRSILAENSITHSTEDFLCRLRAALANSSAVLPTARNKPGGEQELQLRNFTEAFRKLG